MKNRLIVINSLIFLILASCFQAASHAKTIPAKTSPLQMQKEILSYINQYRMKHGRAPLQLNDSISKEAALHSQEMATRRVPFGHQGFSTRIKHLYTAIKQTRGGAENVAYNYKNAEIVSREWIKSPGHRKNILGNYNLTGIGIAYDKQGKIYYTQMFIRTV